MSSCRESPSKLMGPAGLDTSRGVGRTLFGAFTVLLRFVSRSGLDEISSGAYCVPRGGLEVSIGRLEGVEPDLDGSMGNCLGSCAVASRSDSGFGYACCVLRDPVKEPLRLFTELPGLGACPFRFSRCCKYRAAPGM